MQKVIMSVYYKIEHCEIEHVFERCIRKYAGVNNNSLWPTTLGSHGPNNSATKLKKKIKEK